MASIVYALTNPAMEGLVKVGSTDKADVRERMDELQTTGVPMPFECIAAKDVSGVTAVEAEKVLHEVLSRYRVRPDREFFRLIPEDATTLIGVIPGTDVTPVTFPLPLPFLEAKNEVQPLLEGELSSMVDSLRKGLGVVRPGRRKSKGEQFEPQSLLADVPSVEPTLSDSELNCILGDIESIQARLKAIRPDQRATLRRVLVDRLFGPEGI